jgi:hypothetical protein
MQIGSPLGTMVQSQSGPKPALARRCWKSGNRITTKAKRHTMTTTARTPIMSARVGYHWGHFIPRLYHGVAEPRERAELAQMRSFLDKSRARLASPQLRCNFAGVRSHLWVSF